MKYLFLLCLSVNVVVLHGCGNAKGEPGPEATVLGSSPSSAASQSEQPPAAPAFTLEYLMGKFDPAQHPDFVRVEDRYTDGDTYYLRKDTYQAFKLMWDAAMADGVKLVIISATRNFERQKQIWEAKWTGARAIENGANAAENYPDPVERALKILEYSSMPGTSRHHWGTDIDLNDLDNYTFEQGSGKPIYEWLSKNASLYGFCQPYSPKGPDRPHGYNEEKWHWSYVPVASQLTRLAEEKLRDDMIRGFLGAETAVKIGVVEKYVLGIDPACK